MENVKRIPEIFGCRVFNDDIMRARLPKDVYKSLSNTIATGKEIDASIANIVANAMKDWAIENGATHYTHWFQPLTGVTAEKHEAFISPVGNCKVIMEFSGKELIKGEPDASSFPSGGLRATFEARGYTAWDPGSYAFVKDGSLYIPTAFCSYTGEALDTKTPLLRSMDAINLQALRILRLFGDQQTTHVSTTVGAEQEYFLVDRSFYERRPDLFYAGRTLFGAPAPKGQEMEDHYFGALKPRVSEYMQELDEELWKLGINAKTKHNEAAPAQHELAPIFSTANMAIDQNLLIMEYMKKVAGRHDMVCLLHEKPFNGMNGSGKHDNWALSTDTGKNLLVAGKTPAENTQFLLILAAVVKAVDDYQDMLRLSVASAGNDHRLGGNEAPPAIISIFIGEELEAIVRAIIDGKAYNAVGRAVMNLGVPSVPTFTKDTTDRNRTSPFAFTGNKFEFRMPGSSQNVAMPNIVLNTAVAESFRQFADTIEEAKDKELATVKLIKDTFTEHQRIIFNGNGYSKEWEEEAARRGLLNLPTAVDVYPYLTEEKNIRAFTSHGVMSRIEMECRKEILLENYSKQINIEALTMIDMAMKNYIPAVNAYIAEISGVAASKMAVCPHLACKMESELIERLSELNLRAYEAVKTLERTDKKAAAIKDALKQAQYYRDKVLPAMEKLRRSVDEMETLTAAEYWPYPSYGDLTFGIQG
ncbi:MAG: glutamine synthetase III [Clostridia bacterium]|nr:glutamine synthetase III [Clostridia bacterium]